MIALYVDFDDYDKFEEFFIGLNGRYMSPGGVSQRLGVSRQLVNAWVKGDIINSYRYDGVEGQFVIIPYEEIEKAIIHMKKRQERGIKKDEEEVNRNSSLKEIFSRVFKK